MSNPYDCEKDWPGPTLGYGSKPVGGCGTSTAEEPIRDISDMIETLNERTDAVVDAEMRRALSRAEEQGYRVGYDAASEELKALRVTYRELLSMWENQRRIIAECHADETQSVKSIREARETIRQQRETIEQNKGEITRLRKSLWAVALVVKRNPDRSFEVLRIDDVRPSNEGLVVHVR